MKVRRVVTGHTRDGKATVVSDREVDAITLDLLAGAEFHRLWGADEAPTFPDDGSPQPGRAYFPQLVDFGLGSLRSAPSRWPGKRTSISRAPSRK